MEGQGSRKGEGLTVPPHAICFPFIPSPLNSSLSCLPSFPCIISSPFGSFALPKMTGGFHAETVPFLCCFPFSIIPSCSNGGLERRGTEHLITDRGTRLCKANSSLIIRSPWVKRNEEEASIQGERVSAEIECQHCKLEKIWNNAHCIKISQETVDGVLLKQEESVLLHSFFFYSTSDLKWESFRFFMAEKQHFWHYCFLKYGH